jgi:hypothetical protein
VTIRHIVLFRFSETATPEQVAHLAAGLTSLPERIPEIQAYRHGPDAGINEASWDYAVIGDFASSEDYKIYRDHPDHLELIRERVQPIMVEHASVQLAVG